MAANDLVVRAQKLKEAKAQADEDFARKDEAHKAARAKAEELRAEMEAEFGKDPQELVKWEVKEREELNQLIARVEKALEEVGV